MSAGYARFRGRCKELSEAARAADPTLTLVRGHYYCPIWNSDEQHWWTVREDGTIYDPSKDQFPSKGLGVYTPFSGIVICAECGTEIPEEKAMNGGNYGFCSGKCYGRFVGGSMHVGGMMFRRILERLLDRIAALLYWFIHRYPSRPPLLCSV